MKRWRTPDDWPSHLAGYSALIGVTALKATEKQHNTGLRFVGLVCLNQPSYCFSPFVFYHPQLAVEVEQAAAAEATAVEAPAAEEL